RRIDLLLLSHPHADHFFGMFAVLEQYEVKAFATEDLVNKTQSYQALLDVLDEKQIPQRHILAGDRWRIGNVSLAVVGPTEQYLHQTSPGGTIGESKEFASLVLQLTYGKFSVLFTGDSQAVGLEDALPQMTTAITVLQVPHHGSATGLDKDVLEQINPHLAVISVGAENRYNHPHPSILGLLKDENIPIRRTDLVGDVEVVSDGEVIK
ncbi:MAG: ComEC/Rec2 family competence protein, partial [Acidobacteriota bacterium]